jgi:hypothetical protein
MLTVANRPNMVSVIILSVVILNVVVLSVLAPISYFRKKIYCIDNRPQFSSVQSLKEI